MAQFAIVNGIKTTGEGNVDRVIAPLRALGHEVVDVGLPVIGPLAAASRRIQMRNGRLVRDAIVAAFGEDARVNLICHSNGVPTGFRSMWFDGVRYDNIFAFNGALRSSYAWAPEGFRKLYNIYNPHDRVLKGGEMLSWVMPAHIFGSFGRTGYAGPKDRRIEGVQNGFHHTPKGRSRFNPFNRNHNPFYSQELANDWADWMDLKVASHGL